MIRKQYELELLTDCFCGGAEPEKQAEIRVPSIRGQLRWWFRTLGGFKSLASSYNEVRDQESMIFGSVAGKGKAGKLSLRLARPLISTMVKDAEELDAPQNSPKGYLLFNLRSNPKKRVYAGKGYIKSTSKFSLHLIWKGSPNLCHDIDALIQVFGHLGSLGTRSRRGMGAIALANGSLSLSEALAHFASPENIQIRKLGTFKDSNEAIDNLAAWLKGWRAHGRTMDHDRATRPNPPHNPGFKFAKQDHDAGVAVLSRQGIAAQRDTFRPALGLPIEQFFSGGHGKIRWSPKDGDRFASPVLLRPHRGQDGKIHALVIFVEAHKWDAKNPVYLNGQPRKVSLQLYEAIKKDSSLRSVGPSV